MAGEISHGKSQSNGAWVIDIVRRHGQIETTPKPARIGRVPHTLRAVNSNKDCFDPLVVSLGPYHHDPMHPKPMDRYKEEAAAWFVSNLATCNDEMERVYDQFVEAAEVSDLRDWYLADGDETKERVIMSDEYFMHMMFLDGCFILLFIHFFFKFDSGQVVSDFKNPTIRASILTDMFLLENQIPFAVLDTLMKLMSSTDHHDQNSEKYKKIDNSIIEKFIVWNFLPENDESTDHDSSTSPSCLEKLINLLHPKTNKKMKGKCFASEREATPLHLLDFLRIKLIDGKMELKPSYGNPYYFRSIMELKAAGIKISKSRRNFITEVKYEEGLIYGHLSLPQIMVDYDTKTRLLNLIAYEMCPKDPESGCDFEITSYISLMDSLIDRAEDVKELRSTGILQHRLGSNEEVAKLFNELATNVVPDHSFYWSRVKRRIQKHCKSSRKVRIAEVLQTHFGSPWTTISFTAGVILLLLTLLQTVYTIRGAGLHD